jgi:protein-disulfide isomerase
MFEEFLLQVLCDRVKILIQDSIICALIMKHGSYSSCGKISCLISFIALAVAIVGYFFPKSAIKESQQEDEEKLKAFFLRAMKENPQAIMAAMSDGINAKKEEEFKKVAENIKNNLKEVNDKSMILGNKDAQKGFICFYDPLCPHCKVFQQSMLQILQGRKDVFFKLLPVAVLGANSIVLAKVIISCYSLAKNKVLAVMQNMLNESGTLDHDSIIRVLQKAGVDHQAIAQNDTEANAKLMDNGSLAEQLGIPIVPAVLFECNRNISTISYIDEQSLKNYLDGNSTNSTEEKSQLVTS